MEKIKTKVSALLLYSEKDKGFRNRFEAYLSLLVKNQYLDDFDFLPVEKIKYTEDKLFAQADLFLFVTTTNLIDDPFSETNAFKKIKALHRRKQRLIVPLLYRKTVLYEKVFSDITPVPTNGKPVMDQHWPSFDDALHNIYDNLKVICYNFRKAKSKIEEAWRTAQRQHNPNAYRHFLLQHPNSKYEIKAQAVFKQVTEAHLWRKAQSKDTVEGYYDYLTDSPLKSHRFEAAAAINKLERDTELNWQEIQEKDQLVLYMDYYLRQPRSKNARQAKKIIDERLLNALKPVKGQDLQTQQNSLELMAYKNLEPTQILAMNTHTKYSDKVKFQLLGLLKRRQSSQLLHTVILLLIGLAEIWLFNKFYQPHIDQYGFIDMPTTRMFQLIFIITVNIWLLFRAYLYFNHIQRDITFLSRALYVVQSLSTLLKTAFVSKDQDSVDTIVKFFTRIDHRREEIEKKTFLNYLLQSEQSEPQVLLPSENSVI